LLLGSISITLSQGARRRGEPNECHSKVRRLKGAPIVAYAVRSSDEASLCEVRLSSEKENPRKRQFWGVGRLRSGPLLKPFVENQLNHYSNRHCALRHCPRDVRRGFRPTHPFSPDVHHEHYTVNAEKGIVKPKRIRPPRRAALHHRVVEALPSRQSR